MGNDKNAVMTEHIIKIAGEAGAKAALDAIARKTGSMQTMISGEAYKAAERRLRAFPILQEKIDYDKERLAEYECGIVRGKSNSIVRFNKSGNRLSQDDIVDALMQDLTAQIAADEYEIKLVEDALKVIEKDTYYKTVFNKYILQENDGDIAAQIHCDPSTVRKNRGRLVRQLAVRLYGVDAI